MTHVQTSHLTPPLLHGLSPTLSEMMGQVFIPGCSLSHFCSIEDVSSGSGRVSQLFYLFASVSRISFNLQYMYLSVHRAEDHCVCVGDDV